MLYHPMTMDYSWGQALADELHAEREAQRMTLDDLASRSGVPKVTLQRYLASSREIRVDALDQICRALGLPIGEMATRAQARYDRFTSGGSNSASRSG